MVDNEVAAMEDKNEDLACTLIAASCAKEFNTVQNMWSKQARTRRSTFHFFKITG